MKGQKMRPGNLVLTYGANNGDLEVTLLRGIRMHVRRKAKDTWHPLDLTTLQTIFRRSVHTRTKPAPDHIWLRCCLLDFSCWPGATRPGGKISVSFGRRMSTKRCTEMLVGGYSLLGSTDY